MEEVRSNRGAYVAAALTIVLAWRRAGSPRADVSNIVTLRQCLGGLLPASPDMAEAPDPATTLLAQVRHDPDADALGALLTRMVSRVRLETDDAYERAIEAAEGWTVFDLCDAMCEFPIEERGSINPRSSVGN